MRWWVAVGVALALVIAGLQGAAAQAASAAPARAAGPSAPARPAVTPLEAASRAAASVPAAVRGRLAAQAAADAARTAARRSGRAVEVAAERTPFSQTFANPDGSFTTTTSTLPRWVRRGSSWAPADAALTRQPDGSWAPAEALGALSLSGGGSGALVTEGTGGRRLSLTWPGTLPAPRVLGPTATYDDVLPGVNLAVTANAEGGFSDTLVITSKAAAADPQLRDLRLGVSASAGLTARPGAGGSLAVADGSGRPAFSSPAPLAWDSRGPGASAAGPGAGGAGVVAAPASYSAGSVRLGVPASLLADPAADFPLYVDPSYTGGDSYVVWGMDEAANPAANYEHVQAPVGVGDSGSGGVERGEYLFGPTPPPTSGPVTVTSATMTATAVGAGSSASTSHTVNVYSTSQYGASTTWSNPPTVQAGPAAATFTTTSASPSQNVSWNVTSFLQSSFTAGVGYLSLQLQNSDEADPAPWVAFGDIATLSYTYTQPAPVIPAGTGPVAGATFLKFPISDKVSLEVNVGSGNALLATSDLTMPEIGGNLTLGATYNSLLGGSVTGGSEGSGFRQQGVDTRLYLGAGTGSGTASGSVTYLGADGLSGVFTPPASGSVYTSPPALHATLTSAPSAPCGGSAYQLTWHSSGQVMCFDNAGMLTSQADRNGNATAFSYSGGLESSVAYTPAGAGSPTETVTASSSYPYVCGLSQSGGAAGTKNVTYNFNAQNQLASVQQPDGTIVTFGYDSSGNLNSIKNGAGATTTLTYNSSRQATSVTQPYGSGTATATTRLSYVSATQTQVASPNTNQSMAVSAVPNTTYTINSADLVIATKDPAGNTTSTSYNASTDNVSSSTNQLNGTTTDTYGSNNGESLTKSASPTGASQSWAYGNSATGADPTAQYLPSSSTDGQGNQSLYTYSGAGNPQTTSSALPAKAQVSYNTDGTPATSTDPDGGVTSYGYNSLHQLTTVTPPTSGSLKPLAYTYDGFGRIATVTDGNGNTLTYTYDLADRVTKQAWTGGPQALTVSYAYDGAGNLKTETSSAGPVTSWTYDGRNSVLSVSATSGGGTLSYSYDADGNMLTAADAAGTTSYSYNDLDQLASMTDPTGVPWAFSYNAAGERTHTVYNATSANPSSPYTVKDLTGFDAAGRIIGIEVTGNSGATTLSDNTYCYSPYVSGQNCPTTSAGTDTELLRWAKNQQSGVVTQYKYDPGNRLQTVTPTSGTTYSYTFDSDGDIKTGTSAGALNYNTSNQIISDGATYDHDGGMNYDPANGTLAYNDAGQMTSASAADSGGGGSAAESFTYAGAGQNQPLSDGSASGITYGTADQYGQPRVDSYTTAGTTVYILRDQQGDPLGLITGGKSYIYLTDNVGSVTGISGACGCSDASYTYDPYGLLLSKSPGSGGSLVTQNLLGYTGGLTDTYAAGTTGYVHDGARWYNPQIGAFQTQDTNSYLDNPANGNRYAYAADNPANNIDPTGSNSVTSSLIDAGAFGTGVAFAVIAAGCVAGAVGGGIAGGAFGGLLGGVVGAGAGCIGGGIAIAPAAGVIGAVAGVAYGLNELF